MRISLKHWLRLRRLPWLKVFYDSFKRYRKEKREAIRQDFEGVDQNSVVLDFGGFEGLINAHKGLVGKIEQTHNPDWSYPFVWEQWTRK